MVAGRGIAHSERTPPEARNAPGGAPIHGIQTWIALPKEHEEVEPAFEHHPASTLPEIREPGAVLRVIAGEAYGQWAPASVFSAMFYVDASLEPGATVELPVEHVERGVYVAEGEVEAGGARFTVGQMALFAAGQSVEIGAVTASRVMLLGGAPLDGPRYIWWNFVSSSRERIEQAKRDWREQRFAPVPGDAERIPLPEQ
jgi:redox-sensitive bicupin YhaK (pirin superfamily)